MELRALRYFVAVAERESFSRASEDLTIAQPALSAQIAKLEQELGVELFARVGRRVRLTAAGRMILEQARRAVAAADGVADVARLGAEGMVGSLTIGYVRVFPFRVLTRLLRNFRRRRPHVGLDLRELGPAARLAALRRGEIDCGFVGGFDDVPHDLQYHELARYGTVVAVSSTHRLAKRRSVRLSALAGEDWVVLARSVAETYYDTFVAGCRDAGFAPRIAQEVQESRIQLGFVAAGLGVAIVTGAARDNAVRGVHYVSLERGPEFGFGIVAARDVASAPLDALIAAARDCSATDRETR